MRMKRRGAGIESNFYKVFFLEIIRFSYYFKSMILGFKDKSSAGLFEGYRVASLPADLQRVAMRKLKILHNAISLNDLKVPPGNRLEALKGDRQGQYSIRINDQWRICFKWEGNNALDVEIVDYH